MKIIRDGDPETAERNRLLKVVEFTCEECGCVFQANKNEYRFFVNQIQGDWYKVDCPYCETTITPDYSKVRRLY